MKIKTTKLTLEVYDPVYDAIASTYKLAHLLKDSKQNCHVSLDEYTYDSKDDDHHSYMVFKIKKLIRESSSNQIADALISEMLPENIPRLFDIIKEKLAQGGGK